ncbi:hypothetical protein WCP94_002892 [Bilophila wadsworthia]
MYRDACFGETEHVRGKTERREKLPGVLPRWSGSSLNQRAQSHQLPPAG